MDIRVLVDADKPALEAFLIQHRDTSMFLRSNARARGLRYTGAVYESTYLAAFEAGQIVAVLGLSWSGMLLVQAPVHAEQLARATVAESGRKVTAFSGPRAQVERVRRALGLANALARGENDERLYGLQLADLVVPSPNPEVTSRRATAEDRDLLLAWRTAYGVEVLGARDDEPTRKNVAQFLDAQLSAGNVWVATVNGQPVSLSAFNAALPDIVQLGGIYTPPELRGRGYARRAIAAQLLDARAQGVERSVLFTSHPHAVRAYEALGYRCLQDFAVVLLDSAG